jgi:glycosyltransferase involved in cell wall biosynthesis
MDTLVTPKPLMNVLVEMRPAFGGHAGIPQENRLLFRGLASLQRVRVTGLLQTTGTVLARGLPPRETRWSPALTADQQMNRLGEVVISVEQPKWPIYLHAVAHTVGMGFWHVLGGTQKLTRFDAEHFRDFVWRRLFGRTLAPEDFDMLTQVAFRVARVPWIAMHTCGLVTRRFGYPLYPRLDTSGFDVMISETPYPATVSKKTKLVVRYHDAIPLTMPHTISDRRFHQASHYRALHKNVRNGALFVCVSDATRKDLLSIYPELETRSCTIHNVVSHHYFNDDSPAARVAEVVRTRMNRKTVPGRSQVVKHLASRLNQGLASLPYLLAVATVEPRKNHQTLLAAWQKLRTEHDPALKLVLVGELGWHHRPIVRELSPTLEAGDAFLLQDVPPPELRLLYKHARATVCPSLGEGFGLSGAEAMKCGGAVVASDIAVHREVYADAAEYFNPYSADDLARAIKAVIDPAHSRRREELVARGAVVARRYSYEVILPKWEAFLESRCRAHAENR